MADLLTDDQSFPGSRVVRGPAVVRVVHLRIAAHDVAALNIDGGEPEPPGITVVRVARRDLPGDHGARGTRTSRRARLRFDLRHSGIPPVGHGGVVKRYPARRVQAANGNDLDSGTRPRPMIVPPLVNRRNRLREQHEYREREHSRANPPRREPSAHGNSPLLLSFRSGLCGLSTDRRKSLARHCVVSITCVRMIHG